MCHNTPHPQSTTAPSFPKKRIRLSEIYERSFSDYMYSADRKLYIGSNELRAVNKSMACRSPKIGIAVYACEGCGDMKYIYRSCKSRFCGSCGAADTIQWADSTLTKLLNIKHHHIVTTLPSFLRGLSKRNDCLIYDILFRSSAKVLQTWFKRKHNIKPGIFSVLHTAGSDLKYHPHIHMIVSAGGLKIGTSEYVEFTSDYLTKQRYLADQLKLEFRKELMKEYGKGRVKVGALIKTAQDLLHWFNKGASKQWIVSIQKPLSDVAQIVGYVGRYTKRACISEYKLKSATEEEVSFTYNDYKNTPQGEKPLISTKYMSTTQFLDALLQHVPKYGYKAVRYYGIYNSNYIGKIPKEQKVTKEADLEIIFEDNEFEWGEHEHYRKNQIRRGHEDPLYCSHCQQSMKLMYYSYLKKDTIKYDSS